ncbi:MAG: hypothetical protein ACU0A0_12995 [Limimaricola sp.]
MSEILNTLARREDGAVTIDWVVLTAALVGLTVSAMALFVSAAGTPEEAYHTNMGAAVTFVGTLN